MDEIIRRIATLEQELEKMRVGAIPPGAVQAFAVRSAPEGWLPCDGREISRQHYARLFQAIGTAFGDGDGETTFHLPDLQGLFVRGWDAWGDVDPERKFGSLQEDAFQGHRHASLGHRHDAVCQSAGGHTHGFDGNKRVIHSVLGIGGYSMYEPFQKDKRTNEAGEHRHGFSISQASEIVASPAKCDCGDSLVNTETHPKNLALLYCIKT
jgi:microcystin-dependent protein